MATSYTPEQLANINLQTIIESSPSNTIKMSDALRATVSLLKTFDGNNNHLEAFINVIDIFHNRYYTGDESQKEFVNLAIQSKLIGEANDFVMTRPDLTTWPVIREALRLKFGDPISRQNLTQQLMFSVKNRNESALDYVDKLKTLVHRITSKIQSEPLDPSIKHTLIAQTELTATHNLMSNVPQELKTILIIQNPTDLTTAQNLIINYEMINNQISFKSHFNQAINLPKAPPTQKPLMPFMQFPQPQTPNYFRQQQANKPFPSQPINIQPQLNKIQKHFPTNSQVFGKPKNVFKPTSNTANFPRPTPMSGVSVQPRKPVNQNINRPNNFRPFNPSWNQTNGNYWRQNPHANPLVFQEITHLENPEETSGESFEPLFDSHGALDHQDQLESEYYVPNEQHVFYDQYNDAIENENFHTPASEEQPHA